LCACAARIRPVRPPGRLHANAALLSFLYYPSIAVLLSCFYRTDLLPGYRGAGQCVDQTGVRAGFQVAACDSPRPGWAPSFGPRLDTYGRGVPDAYDRSGYKAYLPLLDPAALDEDAVGRFFEEMNFGFEQAGMAARDAPTLEHGQLTALRFAALARRLGVRPTLDVMSRPTVVEPR